MSSWEQSLSVADCRITAPRRAVIQALLEAEAPLTPHDILARARATHRTLGLVTVYRTLSLLAELELVRRVHMEDGCHAYLSASPGHSHVVICQRCGRATEFPGGDDLVALKARVEAATGYSVDDHLLQFAGLCPGCQQDME